MQARAIQILFNDILPPELRDYEAPLDKKRIGAVLSAVADKYPERYREISKQLTDLGRNTSFHRGETIRLDDLVSPIDKPSVLARMDAELASLENRPDLSPEAIREAKMGLYEKYSASMEKDTLAAGERLHNSLINHVRSGARGSPFQVKAILTTPALYTDQNDNPIPIFIRNSFSEGLRPHEMFASTFGTRKSLANIKLSTADAGDLGKQMSVAAEDMLVTEKDCGTLNGIPVKTDEIDNVGSVLARAAGGYSAGTVLTKKMLNDMEKSGVKDIVVRSTLTCQAKNGGICSHCAGVRETGRLPDVGAAVGVTAATALGEPLSQLQLSSKHGGGGHTGKKHEYSGFKYVNQMLQSPETFQDKAVVAEKDGTVETVEDAPQGGKFITISGEKHYVKPDYDLLVSPGDHVEAGDELSDGVADPADIVRLKGLGAGRLYFVRKFGEILKESGTPAHRRNLEVLARAALNHVRVTNPEGTGGYLPDDVASYNLLTQNFRPRPEAKAMAPEHSIGRYLEHPVLHYTIGTRITPKVAEQLRSNSIDTISTHQAEPDFEPEMVRLRASTHHIGDWMAKLHSSYLEKNLLTDVSRGRESPMHSTHPVPALARGVEFGSPPKGEIGY